MNKIQEFALQNGTINRHNLSVILDALEENNYIDLDHVLEVILGLKDEELKQEIPECAHLSQEKGELCRFKSYNILNNTVSYERDDVLKLWFKNEADAKAFADGESYYNREYRYSQKEDYQFLGERPIVNTGYCSLDEWNCSI